MKKVLLFSMILVAIFAMVACSHTHTVTGEMIVVKEATCLEEGQGHIFCSECGEIVNTVSIPKTNNHTEVTLPAVDATCTSTGLTEGKHCSRCNEILKEQNIIPMRSHTYDDEYDKKCNVCEFERVINCVHNDPTKIEIVAAVPATCQKTGLSEGMKCTLCGTMVVPQAVVGIIGCIEGDWVVDFEATHTEDGKKYKKCTMCNTILKQDIIPSGNKTLEYTLLRNNTYEVSGIGQCKDKDIVIPSEYNGLPVTSIGDYAFRGCTSLTSVVIGDSVTSIGICAFLECTALTSIEMPDSVTSIGICAFGNCTSLTSIEIPDSVTSIGHSAFYECESLTSIEIPDSVTIIDSSAFLMCTSLTSIEIPNSVTSIGWGAFSCCTSLTSINYDGTIEQWNNEISKESDWNIDTGNYTINCTDGTIAKDGTVTYN